MSVYRNHKTGEYTVAGPVASRAVEEATTKGGVSLNRPGFAGDPKR